MDADAAVLTVEFKVNLLEPAVGDRFVARGRVVRAGRIVTVCRAEAVAEGGGGEALVAIMTATMMSVRGREISA
jgi:acyl-coenzyme A thioesterase PaaI-like protein